MIAFSVILGLAGVVATRVGLARLTAAGAARDPHTYWALGLVSLLPAWFVAFVGLLGTQPVTRPPVVTAVAFVLSVAAMLIGAISTVARARAAGERVEPGETVRLWRLGVLAFLPAWLIALGGNLLR